MVKDRELKADSLSEDTIYEIILEVISGRRLLKARVEGKVELIVLKQPTSLQVQLGNIREQEYLQQAILEGFPTEETIPEELKLELFSVEDLEHLGELESKIKAYEVLLKKRIKGTDLHEKDSETLSQLRKEKEILAAKQRSTDRFTAEYKAKEDKYFHLLCECSYDLEENQLWDSSEEFLDRVDITEAYLLLNNFLEFYWGYSPSILRRVARDGLWKIMYLSAKVNTIELTKTPMHDASINFLQLLSWSMYYDNISEMLPTERPTEDIIEDDEKLDAFMEEHRKKTLAEVELAKKDRANKNRSTKRGNRKFADDSDQVIVTAESGRYVELHKQDAYSDTSVITGRAKDVENSSEYSEVREAREIRRRNRGRKRR
jgi:hypothetical protein